MKNCSLFLDGGTTRTRFSLFEGDTLLARTEQVVGASSTPTPGRNQALEQAVAQGIARLEAQWSCTITQVFACGMITSNAGLCEVPHLPAPVGMAQLAAGMSPRRLPEVSEKALFYLLPGVRFHDATLGSDVMRGEEAEICGALEPDDHRQSILFAHFGSHNKMILCQQGQLQACVTTLSGELLWAVSNHTILRSTVEGLDSFQMQEEAVLAGYQAAQKDGLTRALFVTRIRQLTLGANRDHGLSFLYGALVSQDMRAFSPLLEQYYDRLVLYGQQPFIQAFLLCLNNCGVVDQQKIRALSHEQSQQLSVMGLRRLAQQITPREGGVFL